MEAGQLLNQKNLMPLTKTEIQERIQTPLQAETIRKAKLLQERTLFHTNSIIEDAAVGRAMRRHTDFVSNLLKPDKMRIYKSLLSYPTETADLTDDLYSALFKVFDGVDPVLEERFTDDKYKEDWTQYKESELDYPNVWKDKIWTECKDAINSFVVVDMQREQQSGLKNPYFYTVNINNIIDYKTKEGEIIDLLFRNNNELFYLDSESYQVFELNESNEVERELVNNSHTLNRCPATWLWKTEVKEGIKRGPITAMLTKLDWLQFWKVSKKHADIYSAYTIFWHYEQDCNYEAPGGVLCEDGYLVREITRDSGEGETIYLLNKDRKLQRCPKCTEQLTGAGTIAVAPIPQEGQPSLTPPVGKIEADTEGLKYNVSEMERQEQEIYRSVTGNQYGILSKEAVNTMQITSVFESTEQALLFVQKNLEELRIWVDTTICELRYESAFIKINYNMGTRHFIATPDIMLSLYVEQKKNGADGLTLDSLYDSYLQAQYKNNIDEYNRSKIILAIDPYRHLSNDEVRQMYRSGDITYQEYMLKINLVTLVSDWEMENINVLDFGSAIDMDFNTKVNLITDSIKLKLNKPNNVIIG